MRTRPLIVTLACLTLAAGVALAQPSFDPNGTWSLDATVNLPDAGGTCEYSGQATLTETSGVLSGSAELFLQTGPGACPAEMSGDLSGEGSFDGPDFFLGGQITGPLGTTNFSGQLSPEPPVVVMGVDAPRALNPDPGGAGSFQVTTGDFTGSTGTWLAALLPVSFFSPKLAPAVLTLLLLLLLGSGYWLLVRRQADQKAS